MQPKNNRRNWPRHQKQYLVHITTSLLAGSRPATVSNFSRGGLCFFHSEPLDKGAKVMIRLAQDLIGLARDVRATVKWCVPSPSVGYVVGVQCEEPLRWAKSE